jgi:hypothetical protein
MIRAKDLRVNWGAIFDSLIPPPRGALHVLAFLRAQLVAVIGSSFVGLEVAAASRRRGLEQWVLAERQGKAAARAMLGVGRPFTDVPFFWSVHHDLTLPYVGHARKWDAVEVGGDLAARDAAVVFRRSGVPLAVVTVGRDRLSLAEAALERRDQASVDRLLAAG